MMINKEELLCWFKALFGEANTYGWGNDKDQQAYQQIHQLIKNSKKRRNRMPGNIISINSIADFCIGDNKMKNLLKWLYKNGCPHNREAENMFINVLGRQPSKKGRNE